jgi:alkylated DNA repair dioxygenase AlkB
MKKSAVHKFEKLYLPDAEVWYAPEFFSPEDSDHFLQELQRNINWKQEKIKLFGKEQLMPRLTAWYGDKAYTYSGLQNKPQPWIPVLQQIREQVMKATATEFNSVLLNMYRSGGDSMGWHADDEPELGPTPDIASVSLGAARRFGFKHRYNKDIGNKYITLQHGSLLLMQGLTQHNWKHGLPKTTQAGGVRINLTFRHIIK